MRRGLLKRATAFDEAVPESMYPTDVPGPRPQPSSQTTGLNQCPASWIPTAAPKRRPKPVRVGRLYPEKASEPQMHAKALLAFIQEECPQLIGAYVPCSDLARSYEELAAVEGWSARGWTAIARHLGMLTSKKYLKRAGKRFTAYRIPKP